MSIFSDTDDVRPDWWDMASCNTGNGGLAEIFFPSLPGRAPVEPDPADLANLTEAQRDKVRAAYERDVREFSRSLAVMKAQTEKAQGICAECPVGPVGGRDGVCYTAAVARGETAGIWGGVLFTPRKVKRLRGALRLELAATAA
jgi:hypothetical protein